LISLYEDAYQERLAICLSNNVPEEIAKELAHQSGLAAAGIKEAK